MYNMMKELTTLYAEGRISMKEFIKGLLLLEASSPIASSFIEALRVKGSKGTQQAKEGTR